ncbi:MAG TPA: MFS transporter [Ktedonobacteraceae bacterium]|nr:MFS transporter [Ktedonobacteraceae bacterium]
MYTLEDDQETSSRLNKRDIAAAESQAGTFGDDGELEVSDIDTAQSGSSLSKRFSTQQITSSFKKLTTPGKTSTGNKHVALAALTIACIGVFFTALDQTVVVTALPQMIVDLDIPITQLDHAAWIISAYLLGFIIAMPLMGRVSDIYGRRRIFLLCLVIFGAGSLCCGLAPFLGDNVDLSFLSALDAVHLHIDTSSPGLIWLIAARLFQAIGGGAVVPVAMAIAGDFYGQERRGLALGIIGAVTEAGGVLGPLYGALVVQHLGWQYIFYLNVPLVIALLIAAWIFIPKGTRLHEGIDWIGAILLGLALTCLSLGLAQQGTELGPTTANGAAAQNNPIALALAGVFLVAFVLVERKVHWPVVELSLFKRFPFSATSLVSLLVGAALIIAMADIPIFVDTVLQLPVLDSGLALLRLTAMIPLGALLGGWLCSRISCRFTGVLGLLFTASGFYLMSRWPIHVDWTQITISTVTAGLGFGLVIAPIGTTAINAVKATQAGMSSAVVTALRMVGMMLGLAALTSWALAYFKHLVSTYPSLPLSATADQFKQWSQGYAVHVIASAHTTYSAVFFATMVLCLIAIIPGIFLWGNKAPEAEEIEEIPTVPPVSELALHEAVTLVGTDISESTPPAGDLVVEPGTPPIPPVDGTDGDGGKGGRNPRRRRLLIIASVALILLLIAGGVLAAFLLQPDGSNPLVPPVAGATPSPNAADTPTPTAIAGPRMIQLALDKGALTAVFISQLNLQQGPLTDLTVVPKPNDGLILSLNLHIDARGIHRVMPIELDGVIGIDKQQNLHLHVLHLLRDGKDAGPTAAGQMEIALNQVLQTSVMPSLRGQLKGVKLISVHTSQTIACGKGAEMLVLLVQAPPIEGIAAQLTPVPFCFSGPIDLNKLLPH